MEMNYLYKLIGIEIVKTHNVFYNFSSFEKLYQYTYIRKDVRMLI